MATRQGALASWRLRSRRRLCFPNARAIRQACMPRCARFVRREPSSTSPSIKAAPTMLRLGEEFHHNGLSIRCAQIGRVPRGLDASLGPAAPCGRDHGAAQAARRSNSSRDDHSCRADRRRARVPIRISIAERPDFVQIVFSFGHDRAASHTDPNPFRLRLAGGRRRGNRGANTCAHA